MRKLLESIEKTNSRYKLFQKGDRIVLGLSGGPDSTALFLSLLKLRKKYGLKLFLAHLNHGLSVKKGLEFERFSEKLAHRFEVPFFKKRVNLKKLSRKNHRTLEEMGRIERYLFFGEVAKKMCAEKIATAHTLDDQAETVLMRVARGTGLKGLAGIPAKRNENGRILIRPFIGISKKEILRFLKESNEPFCQDPSNQRDFFSRNRVRNNLLPWIEKNLNPQIRESLSDLGKISSEVTDLLGSLSAQALKKCLRQKSGSQITLDLAKLNGLLPAIRSEVLFQALFLLKGNRLRFGASHIEMISHILDSPENSLRTHLPGFVTALKEKGALRIFDTHAK